MKRLIFTATAAVVCSAAMAEGWSAGAGVILSDIRNPDADKPIFPHLRTDDQQYMVIPSIRYEWTNWAIGVDGVTRSDEWENGLETYVTVGYPSASAGISGEVGWFQYGFDTETSIGDWTTESTVTLGPVSGSWQTGIADESDEQRYTLEVGAPILLKPKSNWFVFGSLNGQWESKALLESIWAAEGQFANDYYFSPELGVTSIKSWSNWTWILSTSAQLTNETATSELSRMPEVQVGVFSMFSYQFGS